MGLECILVDIGYEDRFVYLSIDADSIFACWLGIETQTDLLRTHLCSMRT